MHREQEAFHIDGEERVIVLLRDRTEGGTLRHTGIREHTIEPALLSRDVREEAIKIAQVRHVAVDAGDMAADLLDRCSSLWTTAPRDEDIRAFVHKLLRRRQANTAIATRDEGNFSFQLPHIFLLRRCALHRHCMKRSRTKRIAEHGKAALGSLARGFVLNHIPVLGQKPVLDTQYVCHNPVHREAKAAETPVQDHVVAISNYESWFILQGRGTVRTSENSPVLVISIAW